LACKGEIKTADIFFRFVAAYLAFMAILTNKYSYKERGREVADWQRLKWFSREAGDWHKELLDSAEYREAVDRLAARPIYNMQKNKPNPPVEDKENLKEILDCTRYIRNNLFHAGKDPGNTRDRSLVEVSYTVVSKLIEPYLKEVTIS
jgi:hypothetical protein